MLSVAGWLLALSAILCGSLQTATVVRLRFGLHSMDLRKKGRSITKALWLYVAAISLMLLAVLFLGLVQQT